MSKSHLLQGVVSQKLPLAVSGKGIYIKVEDPVTGEITEVIDGCTGAAVGALGHGDPDMLSAINDAAEGLVYSFPLVLSNNNAENFAEFLCDISPKGAFLSAIFTGSGSESNENAMKIIRQYHVENGDEERTVFISRDKSYHGYTIGAMSISGSRREPFEPLLMDKAQTPKADNVYRYREMLEGESEEQYKDRLLANLESVFQSVGPNKVAAFITETVSGSTIGTETPVLGYLEGCREICHKYGALFMLDEVMCGMSRCGTLHAWEQFLPLDSELSGATGPDIQSIGKTLGSGYVTIAGVLISPKVRDVIIKGTDAIPGAQTYHSHSFNCKVAFEVQKKIQRLKLTENIMNNGNYLGQLLKEKLLPVSKYAVDVRGAGGFWSVEFAKDKETKEMFSEQDDFGHVVGKIAYKNGLLVMAYASGNGEVGDRLTYAPAYAITREDVEKMVDITVKSVLEAETQFNY